MQTKFIFFVDSEYLKGMICGLGSYGPMNLLDQSVRNTAKTTTRFQLYPPIPKRFGFGLSFDSQPMYYAANFRCYFSRRPQILRLT